MTASALDDSDLSVRHAAVEALAGINTLEARPRLQDFLAR